MVRIMTDSTCDLSPERQKALGVEVVERPLASETLNYARHSFARLSAAVTMNGIPSCAGRFLP